MKKIIIKKDSKTLSPSKPLRVDGYPTCPLCGSAMIKGSSAGCIRYFFVIILTLAGIVGLFFYIIPGVIILLIAGAMCPRKTLRCPSCGNTHQRS